MAHQVLERAHQLHPSPPHFHHHHHYHQQLGCHLRSSLCNANKAEHMCYGHITLFSTSTCKCSIQLKRVQHSATPLIALRKLACGICKLRRNLIAGSSITCNSATVSAAQSTRYLRLQNTCHENSKQHAMHCCIEGTLACATQDSVATSSQFSAAGQDLVLCKGSHACPPSSTVVTTCLFQWQQHTGSISSNPTCLQTQPKACRAHCSLFHAGHRNETNQQLHPPIITTCLLEVNQGTIWQRHKTCGRQTHLPSPAATVLAALAQELDMLPPKVRFQRPSGHRGHLRCGTCTPCA